MAETLPSIEMAKLAEQCERYDDMASVRVDAKTPTLILSVY